MIALAFYKGSSGNGNGKFIDRAIRFWTRGAYSHVEIAFIGRVLDGRTLCFSSSNRDGGTRQKWIALGDGKWDVVNLPTRAGDDLAVAKWCGAHSGRKYDYAGVFGFLCWPFVRQDPKKYFCSEVCVRALQTIGLFKGVVAWKVSPNRLWKLVAGED